VNTPTTGADSPTPRTEEQLLTGLDYRRDGTVVDADFARQLERELTEARAEVERLKNGIVEVEGQTSATLLKMQERNATLRAQLAALEADKARLDWLDANMTRFICYSEPESNGDWYRLEYWQRELMRKSHEAVAGPDLRSTIDNAMKTGVQIDAAFTATKPTQ